MVTISVGVVKNIHYIDFYWERIYLYAMFGKATCIIVIHRAWGGAE